MSYLRYHIDTAPAPNTAPHPNRFTVHINRLELAKLLLKELVEFRGDMELVLSRPCVYGVFSGPLGGFVPREQHCVGCLRCTVQYPKVAQIHRNPERLSLGDSYFTPDQVDTALYEAASGRVPVRGAGYGGGFGGAGWDAMWTDMSEIVRPTRDGIHGREYISTAIELGGKPRRLDFDAQGMLVERRPQPLRLPIPILFDPVPELGQPTGSVATAAAARLGTLAFQPLEALVGLDNWEGAAPRLRPDEVGRLLDYGGDLRLVALDGWDEPGYGRLRRELPDAQLVVRHPLGEPVAPLLDAGVEVIHLMADYHGQTEAGFAMSAIRDTHEQLVAMGRREQVSLIGSGGIVAAEHVPKAIISGLDAVALDTVLLIAVQGQFQGEFRRPGAAAVVVPEFDRDWGVQRICNLVASWRDQLLEVLGAMGLREVRRLRGELGRAMMQAELELEAFGDIPGYGESR